MSQSRSGRQKAADAPLYVLLRLPRLLSASELEQTAQREQLPKVQTMWKQLL
jgi:hypothetical protein